MSFDPTEVAYCAGLFEGEGSAYSVGYYYAKGEKRARKTPQIKIQMSMTDREPLERFASVMGGRVHGPYDRDLATKPIWMLSLEVQAQAREALEAMSPWLSPRRQAQVEAALNGSPWVAEPVAV